MDVFLTDSGAIDYDEFLALMAKLLNDADTEEELLEVLAILLHSEQQALN